MITCNDLKVGESGKIVGGIWDEGSYCYVEAKKYIGTIIKCIKKNKDYNTCKITFVPPNIVNNASWCVGGGFSTHAYYLEKIDDEEEKDMDKCISKKTEGIVAINFKTKGDFDDFYKKVFNTEEFPCLNWGKGLRCKVEYLGYSSQYYDSSDLGGVLPDNEVSIIDLTNDTLKIQNFPKQKTVRVGEYDAIVEKDGEFIRVGCQTISFKDVEKAYFAMKEVKDS